MVKFNTILTEKLPPHDAVYHDSPFPWNHVFLILMLVFWIILAYRIRSFMYSARKRKEGGASRRGSENLAVTVLVISLLVLTFGSIYFQSILDGVLNPSTYLISPWPFVIYILGSIFGMILASLLALSSC